MTQLKPHNIGLVLGAFMVIWHALWSLLVITGFAQKILLWVFNLHFMEVAFRIKPFSVGTAFLLLLFTGATGYLIGYLFGWLWNKIHKKAHEK